MERFFRLVEIPDIPSNSPLPKHRIERRTPGNASNVTPPRQPPTTATTRQQHDMTTSSSELRVVRRHVLFAKCLRKFPQIWVRKDARLVLTLEESTRVGLPTTFANAAGDSAAPPSKVCSIPDTLDANQLKILDGFLGNDDGDLVRGVGGNFSYSSREIEIWEYAVVVMTTDERINFILTVNDLDELNELKEIKRINNGGKDANVIDDDGRRRRRGRVNSKELRRQKDHQQELAQTSDFLFRASIQLIEEKNRALEASALLENLRKRYPEVLPARNEIVHFGRLRVFFAFVLL